MVRLGLSDSMRSDVALEATEPLHTATHRRMPRRPCVAPPAATAEASSEQQTRRNAVSFRTLLGGILCVVLLVTGLRVLGTPLRAWQRSTSQVAAQFDQLERHISLLGRDTARLKTTANTFLQRCQDTQVSASTRTQMLQTSSEKSFSEQAKTQLKEHEQVKKEVMLYYAQQERKIKETRERLVQMNVTLPVHIAVRSVPESWQKQRLLEDGAVVEEGGDDRLGNAVKELSFITEASLQRDGSDRNYPRLSVEHISIQTSSESSKTKTRPVKQSTTYGSTFLFYVCVICVSAGYLWNAVSKKKELMEDKWSWSPVPKVLRRLNALLSSVVVIDDLRETSSEGSVAHSLEHVEHIEF
ncbi:hypothetical protein PRNP1_000785 [Phytophthora ramorum]